MRWIAFVAVGLVACADDEKVVALEKKVADLEAELVSTRKELDDRIEALESDKDAEKKVDDLQRRIDALAAQTRSGYAAPPRPVRPQPDAAQVYSVPVDGYPSIGPADAKVTVVEAYDYACPFCEKSRPTMRDLRDKYRGDVRIVYKPLVVHPRNAMAGALAACAAHRQGKFAQMDAAIWDKGFNTRTLDESEAGQGMKCWDTPDGCRHVVGYARDLGLNVAKFKQDMRDCTPSIARAMSELQALSVTATPGFFVNGRFLAGAQPLDRFAALVDEELRKANERIASGARRSSYYDEWIVQQGKKSLDPTSGAPGVP